MFDDWERYPELDFLTITAGPQDIPAMEQMIRDAVEELEFMSEERAGLLQKWRDKLTKFQGWVDTDSSAWQYFEDTKKLKDKYKEAELAEPVAEAVARGEVATVVTRVLLAADDPVFDEPEEPAEPAEEAPQVEGRGFIRDWWFLGKDAYKFVDTAKYDFFYLTARIVYEFTRRKRFGRPS